MPGIDDTIDRIAELVAGEAANADKAIAKGRFRRAADRPAMERYPEGGAAARPFAIEHTSALDRLPESGESNVSGNLVDSTHELELIIPYLSGGGSLGQAHPAGLTKEQARDWRRIRRCLGTPSNIDEQLTGCMSLSLGKAKPSRPRTRGKNRVVLMVVPMTVLQREDWTQEP